MNSTLLHCQFEFREYRKKKGILKSLKQLSLYEEFTPIDLERIEPYICYNK